MFLRFTASLVFEDSLVRLRLVPLLAGVDPAPRGTEQPKGDDHHQTDGDDDVHARPLRLQKALPMNGSMRPQ